MQRATKFARYLPDFGYTPVVVTGPVGDGAVIDKTLVDELPPCLEIHRGSELPPVGPGSMQARFERLLRVRSAWTRWWIDSAIEAARNAPDVDVILATMSPFDSSYAAAAIARERGIPWIADLRDPWALDEMIQYPTFAHRKLAEREMGRALASAAAVILNTQEAAIQVQRRFPGLRNTIAIPNGYDSDDFAGDAPQRDDRAFRIVHTGHLHTANGTQHRRTMLARRMVGGSIGRVDILTRSHVILLEALERLVTRDPLLRGRVELHLAGNLTDADRGAARSDLVRLHGYLAHADSVALVRTADLLFLPMHDLAPGTRARIVPAKTYEYVASGRPILAAVPDGDARDLLEQAGTAFVCDPADVERMAEIISERIACHDRADADPILRADVIRPFERRTLTARLAEVIDATLRSRGAASAPAGTAR